jgi:type IV pilus assembly protein PilX
MTKAVSLRSPRRLARRQQRGYLLVTALLFLVVLTLLGLGLFRSTGLMDRISANTRDKDRAFEAAQAALQYAEWALANGKVGVDAACTGMVNGNNTALVHVCNNALASPTAAPWPNGYTYTPPNLTVGAGGGLVSATNPDINYAAAPIFYIFDLGFAKDGKTTLYEVTAAGFGGNAATMSVVRSTFALTPSSTCTTCGS